MEIRQYLKSEHYTFSTREKEVLKGMADDFKYHKPAEKLFISPLTIYINI